MPLVFFNLGHFLSLSFFFMTLMCHFNNSVFFLLFLKIECLSLWFLTDVFSRLDSDYAFPSGLLRSVLLKVPYLETGKDYLSLTGEVNFDPCFVGQ